MQEHELEDIDGIGPSYAEQLASNGFESVQDIATADPDDVSEIASTLDGEDVVQSAQELVDTDQSGTDESGEAEQYELDCELSTLQRNHLICALVREEIRARKRNNMSAIDVAQSAIDTVISDKPNEFTSDELDTAWRGVNQLVSEYRGERGLGSFTTEIKYVAEALNDARQETRSE